MDGSGSTRGNGHENCCSDLEWCSVSDSERVLSGRTGRTRCADDVQTKDREKAISAGNFRLQFNRDDKSAAKAKPFPSTTAVP